MFARIRVSDQDRGLARHLCHCERINARFRDELLNGEFFYCLRKAQILIEKHRNHYDTKLAMPPKTGLPN